LGVPTHAIDLRSEMRERRVERLGAVHGFRISGAAAPASVVTELMPRRGAAERLRHTETCSHQYTLPGDMPERIGRAPAAVAAKAMRSASGVRTIRTRSMRENGNRGKRSSGLIPRQVNGKQVYGIDLKFPSMLTATIRTARFRR